MIDKKIIDEMPPTRRITLPKSKLKGFKLKKNDRLLKFYIQGENEDWIGKVYDYKRQCVIRVPEKFCKIRKKITLWFTDDMAVNLYILKEVKRR